MKRSNVHALLVSAGLLVSGAIAGGVWAAQPTQADIDFCNRQAAASTSGGQGSNQTTAQTPGAPSARDGAGSNRTGGRITDSTQPGANTAPGAGPAPGVGNNPTGGRITDSSQPGAAPAPGMAASGQSNPTYRQAYMACLQQRVQ